jgi:type II secretory pathway component PulM
MQSSFNAAASTVSNAMPSSGDLQAQLNEAKAQIARLTQQASEASGLRQRKTEPTHDSRAQMSTAMDTRQAPAGGVSVQITALLCLVSFLLAYFLF